VVTTKPKNNVKNEYITWLATPKRELIANDLPTTKKAFAALKGVSQRTLTRWEGDEDFKEILRQRRNERVNDIVEAIGPPRPVTHATALKKYEVPEVKLSEEDKYLKVKDTLVDMATQGSQGAIDMYMKHYGKSFVEAEQASGLLFSNMSDDELLQEVFKLLGVEKVSSALALAVASD
jgi:hypothetical protein